MICSATYPSIVESHAAARADFGGLVEVFAGVGSVASAFEKATPLKAAYLCDNDPVCRETFLLNGGTGETYETADVASLSARQVLERIGGRAPVGLLGCPPCQGWSTAGRRAAGDGRNGLLLDFFRLVEQLAPRFVLMENVPAVASRPELQDALQGPGRAYQWWVGVLNAAAYGLPQTRQRMIAIGYHLSLQCRPTAPAPTHAGSSPVWDYGRKELVAPSYASIDRLLAGTPRLAAGTGSHAMAPLFRSRVRDLDDLDDLVTVGDAIADLDDDSPPSVYASRLNAGKKTSGQFPWGHRPETVRRMATVPEGGDGKGGKAYHSQAYGRLHRQGLARTVTTNFHNSGSGRFWHYARQRTITPREAARLQGFCDDFHFSGNRSEQERQIGNAFPPLWAEALAQHVWNEISPSLARGCANL